MPNLVQAAEVSQKYEVTKFRRSLDHILKELASSGPYGPFLAIHRAFYDKMSVGKCLVGKCQFDATELFRRKIVETLQVTS